MDKPVLFWSWKMAIDRSDNFFVTFMYILFNPFYDHSIIMPHILVKLLQIKFDNEKYGFGET